MSVTQSLTVKKVQFMFFGIPYVLPSDWVIEERKTISNTIQQTVNPQYQPAIQFSSSSLTVKVRIPSQLSHLHRITTRLLKAALETLSEGLSSEQYANINYDEQIPVDAVGMIVSPWSRVRDPNDPAAKLQRGDMQATMSGYMGISNQVVAGYLQNFTSDVKLDGNEELTITFESLNLTTLRQGPPKHEGVPSGTPGADGAFSVPNMGNAPRVDAY